MIFCTFWGSLLSSLSGPYHMPFLVNPGHGYFFLSGLGLVEDVLILCIATLLCFWILCGILSVPQRIIYGLLASSKSLPLFVLLIFSTSSVSRLWVSSCFGAVPLRRSFWTNVVFLLVIHSGMCVSCRHLYISSASLSWIVVNFLNQNTCLPSWPDVF